MSSLQLITPALIAEVTGRARQSPRRRMNHNFHTGPTDNPHRFLNVFLRGSYAAPHRHTTPPKAESFLVLEGRMAALLFDDEGNVSARHVLGPREGAWGVDLGPGAWHTVAALSEVAVCYEVKPGPWDPAADKEFAPWAPREGDAKAAAYLDRLIEGL
ncbi:MAG: WbuC family cupin fold metalloprotein [Bryobacteraceae bacterium]